MGNLQSLTDHPFVLVAHAIGEIAGAVEEELGRKPTLDELCEVLAWGMQSAGDAVVADVDLGRVEKIACKLRPAKAQRLTPGDLVAVPRKGGAYYLGIYITKNRFGHAFGFFKGQWQRRPPSATATFEPCGIPTYTGLHAVWDGSWALLGNRANLLHHFDPDPPIYHKKRHHKHDPLVGEFGSLERATGEIKSIDHLEADRIGLLDDSYRSSVLAVYIPNELARRGC